MTRFTFLFPLLLLLTSGLAAQARCSYQSYADDPRIERTSSDGRSYVYVASPPGYHTFTVQGFPLPEDVALYREFDSLYFTFRHYWWLWDRLLLTTFDQEGTRTVVAF